MCTRRRSPIKAIHWLLVFALFDAVYIPRPAEAAGTAAQPNVIVIVADDMGYADLSAYGHPITRTPVLDRLAKEGQRWTQFYAAAPLCTPSRGALLTGRLPARIGLEAPAGQPNVLYSFSTGGLPHTEVTLAQFVRDAGYATALIGKWHLGYTAEHSPVRHGFDYFFGIPSSNDHDPAVPMSMALYFEEPNSAHWDVKLYRNEKVIERPAIQETLTERFTSESIEFIRKNRGRPFFLNLAYTMPHTPLFAGAKFRGKSRGGLYSDVIEELDYSVGQIIEELKKLGLDRNTLVLFTSDNGPIDLFRERGGSSGMLRGGKGTTWEGGMRVPTIFWGPGLVSPCEVRDLGSQLDLFATVADLIGKKTRTDVTLDGESRLTSLRSCSPSLRKTILYYRQGEIYAVRESRFKAHFVTEDVYKSDTHREEHDPPLIFDLAEDPAEKFPLISPDPELISRFKAIREEAKHNIPLAPSELLKGAPPTLGGAAITPKSQ